LTRGRFWEMGDHHMQRKKESQFKSWMLAQIIILSDPYIWHLLLIYIHRGPSNLHKCCLLSPHLWYRYLEIEKWCTLCCDELLLPSWLMYPFLGIGPICNAIHLQKNNLVIDFHYKNEMANLSHIYPKIDLEWERICIQKYL
jgi:hypothetical protein